MCAMIFKRDLGAGYNLRITEISSKRGKKCVLPASTPFISLTTLTTLGGGVGCGVRCNFGFVFLGKWGLGEF